MDLFHIRQRRQVKICCLVVFQQGRKAYRQPAFFGYSRRFIHNDSFQAFVLRLQLLSALSRKFQPRCPGTSRGREMIKVEPLPGSLSASILPRCSRATRWEMARPRPVPFSLVVKNGSNTLSRFSLEMPMPVSWILILRRGALHSFWAMSVEMVKAPLVPIASSAFNSRFMTTCCNCAS